MIYSGKKILFNKKAYSRRPMFETSILFCMTWSKMINLISNGHLSRFIRSRICSLERTGNGKLATILTRPRERLKWDPIDVWQSFLIVVTRRRRLIRHHLKIGRVLFSPRPTIYGKRPLIRRHQKKIGRVLFSPRPTIYGKRPLIRRHVKIGRVLFSPPPTIYGKQPLRRRHVKIGRVLFSPRPTIYGKRPLDRVVRIRD